MLEGVLSLPLNAPLLFLTRITSPHLFITLHSCDRCRHRGSVTIMVIDSTVTKVKYKMATLVYLIDLHGKQAGKC